jgi:uncharacterized protein (TIGR02246 family)
MPIQRFADALVEHLAALQARDIERFARTIGDDVTVVDGGGTIVSGKDAVIAAHAQWFSSDDAWSFDATVVLTREFGDAGLALLDVSYRNTPQAPASRFLLSLVFVRDAAGAWQFVYDQNTGRAAQPAGV